jgi:hypothetical protein
VSQGTGEHGDLLRAALQDLRDDTSANRLARQSILAGVADDPDLRAIAMEELAYPQAELDLHLRGQQEASHETRADWFGQFVARLSSAVNEVTKSMSKTKRHTPGLRVLAPSRGSVRVVLRAPLPHASQKDQLPADDTTAESRALRLVADMFVMAENHDFAADESPLTAAAQSLSPIARQRVRSVARSVIDSDWEIDGTVSQRGRPLEPLHIGKASAQRLWDELKREVEQRTRETRQGKIDGQRHSLSTMWFIPDGQQRAIEVAVTDLELLEEVTRLSAIEGLTVRCEFTVFLSVPPGSADASSRSYELDSIEPLPADSPLQF